ncbi:MAG: DUF1294 domain-containing protein [Lactobacillales bacterium]|jgi:uncharacterized membrane protein YsdA (DUF1294 family)|nr:DUF1294 domain-containing protein [Lactobacillales bacterium]
MWFVRNPLWSYLIIVNVYLFVLMFVDKQRAVQHKWRIPESQLLILGIIGGGLGGLLAQRLFHHKTRKVYFTVCFLIGIVVLFTLIYFFKGM